MTTEQTEPQATEPTEPESTPAPTATEPDEDTKKLANEQLRKWAEGLQGKVDHLKPLAMKTALGEIGLVPEEGLGLAIVEGFDGEITEEAVAAFAKEKYKYDSGKAAGTTPEASEADRAERLHSQGTSVTPTQEPTAGEQAVSAIDSNDPEAGTREAEASVATKAGQFLEQHYG